MVGSFTSSVRNFARTLGNCKQLYNIDKKLHNTVRKLNKSPRLPMLLNPESNPYLALSFYKLVQIK
jgi:hypothetical protein